MKCVFASFLDILQAAHAAGSLRPSAPSRPDTLAACNPDDPFCIYPPEVMYSGLTGWSMIQGVITLEAYNIAPDRASIRALL